MCLVMIAWQANQDYPLVIAANRDEAFDRPATPVGWWPGEPQIVAGRDLAAGGTWLGISRQGRFGVITNVRETKPMAALRSRGELIKMWLSDGLSAEQFRRQLEAHESAYAGFNLLFGDLDSLHYFSNRDTRQGPLAPGYYAVSNAVLDTPWPKVVGARDHLINVVASGTPDPDAFAPFLRDRTPAPDEQVPTGPWPLEQRRLLSAPFIVGEHYGTRCSTVVSVNDVGRTRVHEQHFAPLGDPTEAHEVDFEIAG